MTIGPGDTLDDYRSLARFRRTLRAVLRAADEGARRGGLTPMQHQLLLEVVGGDHDRDPAVGELAAALQLPPHTALELVRRAEHAGLVTVTVDPRDHRRRLVRCTADGRAALARVVRINRGEIDRFRAEMAAWLDGRRS